MTSIGIDFGTTNSVVARWTVAGSDAIEIDEPPAEWATLGFAQVFPSVFAHAPDGRALFGWAAKLADVGRFEAVKRLFATQQDVVFDDDGRSFVVEEVATMLFAELRRRSAVVDARQAVVTVPANSRGLARHRTKICAGMAGFEVLALINEPTAAAMAYAQSHPGDQQMLVFDWGGGTLDVTVLRSVDGVFMEQASKGLPTKGGLDFDARLRHLILETVTDVSTWTQAERRRFGLEVELAKIRLSTQEFTVIQLPGGDSRRVTRGMFDEACASLIEEARPPIEQCLRDIGAGPGSLDAVVMVGGTSNIPAVRGFVGDLLGRAPVAGIDPMTAVAEGAAIAAAILTGEMADNDFFVSTEHALGTVVLDPRTGEPGFSVLIPRNHMLPAKHTDTFVPVFDDQQVVGIDVIEGDPEVPLDHPDNVILQEWVVELPHSTLGGGRSFDITYAYDVDGILHVTVTDGASGELMHQGEISYGIASDKRALVEISKRSTAAVERGVVAATDGATSDDPEVQQTIQIATVKVIPFLDDDEAIPIRRLVQALESADRDQRDQRLAELRAALAPYSYLL